jgi:protein-tyrosine phosphatase
MRQEARNRGILVDGRARQITRDDLSDYDLILAMDKSNLQYLREMDESNGYFEKMRLFCDYVKKFYHSEVPDPYYGGTEGFRLVMDLLEDGCRNLLDELKLELKLKKK